MGGCVARDAPSTVSDDHLLAKLPPRSHGQLWGGQPDKDAAAFPFQVRVNFRANRPLDQEAQVMLTLIELLWVGCQPAAASKVGGHVTNGLAPSARPSLSIEAALARCLGALRTMHARQCEALADFVVPIANVVLHAPCEDVRKELWENFVLDTVKTDYALAHLFYWAFNAVCSSPQAISAVKKDAKHKLEIITGAISGKAQVAITLARLAAANDAIRKGQKLPEVCHSSGPCVTPLIDLLQKLHVVGEKIVAVKEKQDRLRCLQKLLEEINQQMVVSTPTPILMLAPHMRSSRRSSLAAFLQMPAAEARVLSSKQRAPFLVLAEVDVQDQQRTGVAAAHGGLRALLGACSRRRPASELDQNRWPNPVSGGSSSSSPTSAQPRSRLHEEEHEEIVKRYLVEQDQRPKGLFNYETWDEVVARIKQSSSHGSRPHWAMLSWIVKSNADDVRQEELAYRLLRWFERVFRRHKLKLWLQPFLIIATSYDGGCLEAVTNAISLSDLKKTYGDKWRSLRAYFETAFHLTHIEDAGSPMACSPADSKKTNSHVPLNKAILNFIWSMAGYSVVCYVLAIRDRHNGNILLDDEGHIIHVDFGFMLCGAPGGKALQQMGGFEHSKGFKLTSELVEVLGPLDHLPFKVFRKAVVDGMVAVRQHAEELLALLQLSMLGSENNKMNCFNHPRGNPEAVLEDVCERLGLPGIDSPSGTSSMSEEDFRRFIDRKIDDSVDHWRSWLYDKYQYHFTGIH